MRGPRGARSPRGAAPRRLGGLAARGEGVPSLRLLHVGRDEDVGRAVAAADEDRDRLGLRLLGALDRGLERGEAVDRLLLDAEDQVAALEAVEVGPAAARDL